MHSAAHCGEQHPRGVFRAPYTVQGVPALVAIDSRGDARKHVKLVAGVDEVRATRWLREWLDRIDPQRPQLRLVKPPATLAELRTADPRGWEDHLAWALRVARDGPKLRRASDDFR